MKRSKLTSYFSNLRKESAKNARPSQLRLESLEARQLLSVTDVATLAAASEAEQPAAYTTAAPVSDAVIDVSSVLVTTAAPQQQSEYDVLDANGIDYTEPTVLPTKLLIPSLMRRRSKSVTTDTSAKSILPI